MNKSVFVLALICVAMPTFVSAAPFAYVPNQVDASVSVIDVASNAVTTTVAMPTQSAPKAIAINPAGTRAYVAGGTGVYAISTLTNRLSPVPVLLGNVSAVALSPSGARLYATMPTSSTGQVCVVETATNTSPSCVNVGANPSGIAVSPDGSRAFATNSNGASVSVIDTTLNTVVTTISVGTSPWGVVFNRTGNRAYVANFDSDTVSVIDPGNNTVVDTISSVNNPVGLVVNAAGTRLYVVGGLGFVFAVDTSSNTVVNTIPVGSGSFGISITPRSDRVYVANSIANTVSVIRTSDEAVVDTISVGQTPLAFGQFIGGGRLLDVDGDGEVFATTDLVMMMRWQLGFRGASLIANAIALSGATRTTAEQVESYLSQLDALGSP